MPPASLGSEDDRGSNQRPNSSPDRFRVVENSILENKAANDLIRAIFCWGDELRNSIFPRRLEGGAIEGEGQPGGYGYKDFGSFLLSGKEE